MQELAHSILSTLPIPPDTGGQILGHSRQGRAIRGFRLGRGTLRISLIGGAHADEPVGPWMLRRLVAWLQAREPGHPLLQRYQWWIVPHVNPDGEVTNAHWFDPLAECCDLATYLRHVEREPPGDDMEFGFPKNEDDDGSRPENQALWQWWRSAAGAFALHASLHGMAVANGPWFLIDRAWSHRTQQLQQTCRDATKRLGYRLFDWDRGGEKGFTRLAPGFCTRPDSLAMREHFLALGDSATATRFRPSSMETIRDLGGDCLTLVSEMPIFIADALPDRLTRDDPAWLRLREELSAWRERGRLANADFAELSELADRLRLRPMPLLDQMTLQWTFIASGLAAVNGA